MNTMSFVKDGFICDNPNGVLTENVSLWTIEAKLLADRFGCPNKELLNVLDNTRKSLMLLFDGERLHATPDYSQYTDDRFSHDNAIGWASFFCGTKEARIPLKIAFCAKTPLFGSIKIFGDYKLWQPMDIIFFLMCSNKLLAYLLLPILWVYLFFSCYENKLTKNGGISTDSRILFFVRILGLSKFIPLFVWKYHYKLSDYRLKLFLKNNPNHIPNGLSLEDHQLKLLFRIYFPYNEHPVNVICNNIMEL